MPLSTSTLGVFGQSPRLNGLYTQLCFIFPLQNMDNDTPRVIETTLCKGLERLRQHIPWVGGNVVLSSSGIYEVQFSGSAPTLIVKDLTTTLPGYNEIRQAGFPSSMLDEKIIAPCPTLPCGHQDSTPVFMVQANFVEFGLLLVFAAQHNCLDLHGQVQLIEHFAKACRDEDFKHDELAVANLLSIDIATHHIGRVVTPRIEPEAQSTNLPEVDVQDPEDFHANIWAYFQFSGASLRRLKDIANRDKFAKFISTDDALSGLLWQAVLRSRQSRLGPDETFSKFERQVNARTHVEVPSAYLGNMVYKSQTHLPIVDVLENSLGQLSSYLRNSLEPDPSIEYQMRDAATRLQEELGTRPTDVGTRQKLPLTDIRLSSWAQGKCYDLGFGDRLGKPEAVRRPSFEAWEGLAYFMPKDRNGGIVVAICLQEDDLTRLRHDEAFSSFSTYIG